LGFFDEIVNDLLFTVVHFSTPRRCTLNSEWATP
jgi:hypothetical protein